MKLSLLISGDCGLLDDRASRMCLFPRLPVECSPYFFSLFVFSRSAAEARPFFDECDSSVRAAEQQIKEIERERRHFDHATKSSADRKVKQFQKDLEEQKRTLADFRSKSASGDMNAAQQQEWREQRMRLLESRNIQQDTTSSLQRTQRTIEDATVISAETSVTLESQTEQMEGMRDTLRATDGVLDKSKELLQRMRRRLVTNKMITTVIILLEAGILGLVIYIKYYS